MRRKQSVLFFLTLLLIPTHSNAQNWSGIVAPSRAANWSNAGVSGGIPNRTTQCGSTIAAYGTSGSPQSASTINNAIAACPAGEFVQLGAGTFYLSTGVAFAGTNNVTLRGMGPDQTFLIVSGYNSCLGQGATVCVDTNNNLSYYAFGPPSNVVNWTVGYSQGTSSITLASTPNLSVGMFIILDQNDDPASDAGNNDAFNCQWGPSSGSGPYCADQGPGGAGRSGRGQTQMVQVTACSPSCPSAVSTTVTITPGLYMPNWRSGQSPQAWWGNSTGMVSGDGIENLSVDSTASSATSAIYLIFAHDCWVKNVRQLYGNRNSVWLYQSARNTVRDSYFSGTHNSASQSYGVENFGGSDNLEENNIFEKIVSPFVANGSAGEVRGYNFTVNDYYTPTSGGWLQAANYEHAAGVSYVLNEGNRSDGHKGDLIHGTHNFSTSFRNYYPGWEPGKTGQTSPVNLYSYDRFFNFVGNVLGRSGVQTQYSSDSSNNYANPDRSIYVLGLGDTGGSPVPADSFTTASTMRWGNYDTVNNAVRFVSSEVPSGIPNFPNPVPGSQTLPNSFYLTATTAPNCGTGLSFWKNPTLGTCPPFPPIGPDVSSGNIPGVGGFVNMNPAEVCYLNSGVDMNYGTSVNLTSVTISGNVATFTATGSLPSAFTTNGQDKTVYVSGVNISGYNTFWQVATVGTTTFTAIPVDQSLSLSAGSGGAARIDPVLLFNANNCYANDGSGDPPPNPPTGLTDVVH